MGTNLTIVFCIFVDYTVSVKNKRQCDPFCFLCEFLAYMEKFWSPLQCELLVALPGAGLMSRERFFLRKIKPSGQLEPSPGGGGREGEVSISKFLYKCCDQESTSKEHGIEPCCAPQAMVHHKTLSLCQLELRALRRWRQRFLLGLTHRLDAPSSIAASNY